MNNNPDHNENYPEYIEKEFRFDITTGQKSERIDVFLTNNIRNATRTKVQKAIENGCVTINGKIAKTNKKVQPGDKIICKIFKPPPIELIPENIPLDVVFEDDYLLVVNKKAGMVVHPAFGNRYGTLVNAVLYHTGFRDSISLVIDEDTEIEDENSVYFSDAIRPGVVHRLDKDTSGLIVVSKNPVTHAGLAKQFYDRTITRYYYALIWGNPEHDHDIIENSIGRSPKDRKLFAVVKKDGKISKTEYWVLKRYGFMSLIKVKLWTGRTHQIRVHFSDINHSVVGDQDYGGDKINYGIHNKEFKDLSQKILKNSNRQMLHAKVLGFTHPETGLSHLFESDLPDDMKINLEYLEKISIIT